jgi:hypothetical protein
LSSKCKAWDPAQALKKKGRDGGRREGRKREGRREEGVREGGRKEGGREGGRKEGREEGRKACLLKHLLSNTMNEM